MKCNLLLLVQSFNVSIQQPTCLVTYESNWEKHRRKTTQPVGKVVNRMEENYLGEKPPRPLGTPPREGNDAKLIA